jgi:transcriptional regulator
MHPNPVFRQEPEARALEFAAERGFGVLPAVGPEGVLAAYVPFVLESRTLTAHLVRSNPVARRLRDGPAEALMIVWGPDGYISPDWYGEPDKVPTWNYVAVHLRGSLSLLPEDRLRAELDRLSHQFESKLLPKPLWTTGKVTEETMGKLLRQIVPVELSVATVESTFKLNQNRGEAARVNAAEALEQGGTPGMETAVLAALMREARDA